VLIGAFLVLAVPTGLTLMTQTWSQESGAQGPIVLATGSWLVWRLIPQFQRLASPSRRGLIAAGLSVSLLSYVFGRVVDLVTFEAVGLFGVGLTMLYAEVGFSALARNWFPFFYLAFAIPPPAYVVTALTGQLKQFVSQVATSTVVAFGLPVSHDGVVIYVAQYQLLVEDACSGMNSIFGLLAIGLFYIYLVRGSSVRYALILAALTLPIAIAANILRVIILILLTFFFGDAVAQGFLHFAAGIFLFAVALMLVFALDAALISFARKFRRAT
jgi:exosortase